ncbi:MAG: hypothetical protein LBG95_00885 [Treponema sp.]|nr:hypothetical protein [Treponema sp.]
MAKMTKKPATTKKATAKTTAKKPAAKPKAKTPAKKSATAKKTTTARTKPETVQAKLTPVKTKSLKRPPSTPAIPENIVNDVITNLSAVKADLDNYAACQKAFGFLARSLRIAQTPHINSWSFGFGKTPKLSGVAG